MKKKMRVITERPLNAETPIQSLRPWITDNAVFFKRNQGQFMETPVELSDWKLTIDGLVKHNLTLRFEDIRRLPKRLHSRNRNLSYRLGWYIYPGYVPFHGKTGRMVMSTIRPNRR